MLSGHWRIIVITFNGNIDAKWESFQKARVFLLPCWTFSHKLNGHGGKTTNTDRHKQSHCLLLPFLYFSRRLSLCYPCRRQGLRAMFLLVSFLFFHDKVRVRTAIENYEWQQGPQCATMSCFHEHMIVHLTTRRGRLAVGDWWIEAWSWLRVVFFFIFCRGTSERSWKE